MKRNNTLKILFTCAIIILVALVPFIPHLKNHNESLTLGANLISSISSLITLLIGLKLYSRYGVEKSLIEKQTDIVLQLLEKLKKTTLTILGSNGHILFLKFAHLDTKLYKDYLSYNLLFDESYADGLNAIWDFEENIFLPKEISNAFKNISIFSIASSTTKKNNNNRLVVTVDKNPILSEISTFNGLLNDKEITLKEFIGDWGNLITVSLDWLNNHSNTYTKLNFEIYY